MATNNKINTNSPIEVAAGGQGNTSLVTYTPIVGGTTTTSAVQSISSLGSSGTVLISGGPSTIPSFGTPDVGALILIETLTASASSTIEFTTGITGYSKYCLIIENVTLSAGPQMMMRVTTNGGSSWLMDSGYFSSTHFVPYNSTTVTANAVGGGNQFVINDSSSSTSDPSAWVLWIYNIGTTLKMYYVGEGALHDSSGTLEYASPHGSRSVGSTINGFQLLPASGTITTGTFSLYGVTD